MFETVGDHAEGQSLDLCFGVLRCLPICEDPGEVNDLCDPAPILFLLKFNQQRHSFLAWLSFILRFPAPVAKPR
jgi:hypothetical protein